ncbi:hypothetical protein LTR86_005967 [Recurvomyces mirabilis]|nr:hypothetical protein LTR86_005967 [Recurvomyces mirabilis]
MPNNRPSPNVTGLAKQQRYITAHDDRGKSIFSTIDSAAVYEEINHDMDFFLAYASFDYPVQMQQDSDLTQYDKAYTGPQLPIVIAGGTVLRVCNFAPGSTTAMHRSLSLDYGIVVAGEVELLLDSGETRLMKAGDISIQRGTMHAWKTPEHQTGWSRMVFILQDAEGLEIGGVALKNDYGGIGPSRN